MPSGNAGGAFTTRRVAWPSKSGTPKSCGHADYDQHRLDGYDISGQPTSWPPRIAESVNARCGTTLG